ncbi:MAG: GspH/FimT family pseudopilin [Rhodobacteraceae bacterium]|nr:GspH/FimT family pseudopilin [Paracoccaceae bacterium]
MSAPAAPPRGFSLIELMVVITIVSVVTVGAALSFGSGAALTPQARSADAERAARAFESAMRVAQDRALFGARVTGLRPQADGWQIVMRDADGTWQTRQGTRWSALGFDWQVNGASIAPGSAEAPVIRVLPDGRVTPFRLRMQGRAGGWQCAPEGAGVTCAAL